jgi:hypothetical protein
VKFGSSSDYHDCRVFINYLAITKLQNRGP